MICYLGYLGFGDIYSIFKNALLSFIQGRGFISYAQDFSDHFTTKIVYFNRT